MLTFFSSVGILKTTFQGFCCRFPLAGKTKQLTDWIEIRAEGKRWQLYMILHRHGDWSWDHSWIWWPGRCNDLISMRRKYIPLFTNAAAKAKGFHRTEQDCTLYSAHCFSSVLKSMDKNIVHTQYTSCKEWVFRRYTYVYSKISTVLHLNPQSIINFF